MSEPGAFKLPKTLSDDNEFGLPKTPYYFTFQEFGIIFMVPIFFYILSSVITTNAIAQMGMTAVVGFAFMQFMQTVRRGKPPSYIWDWRYNLGTMANAKGLLPVKPKIYNWFRSARPSGYVVNRKRGEKRGFLIDSDFRQHCYPFGRPDQPLLRPLPLFRPRLVINYDFNHTSPAPGWWHVGQGDDTYVTKPPDLNFDIAPVSVPMVETDPLSPPHSTGANAGAPGSTP